VTKRSYPVGVIVLAQLFGTSLWFSPNSAADDLMHAWGIGVSQFAWLTASTQLGFIVGTLYFAMSGLADRFPASRIFFASSLIGATINAGFALVPISFEAGLFFRFSVGVCLAGIYPMGMKMIVSWVGTSSALELSLLVGMLTLGTALPHGVRALGGYWSWQHVILVSSFLALLGALLIFYLGDGKCLPKPGKKNISWGKVLKVFTIRNFRSAGLGYFGHMWELYAFWTALPWFAARLVIDAKHANAPVLASAPSISFIVIACGFFGCVAGGKLSLKVGGAYVAAFSLFVSGFMCAVYPMLTSQSVFIRFAALCVWGFFVIADSPQFSSLAAQNCPRKWVGSALTIQNSVGFALTIVSVLLSMYFIPDLGEKISWILLPGPVCGLIGLMPLLKRRRIDSRILKLGIAHD
jgi:MFS family permease